MGIGFLGEGVGDIVYIFALQTHGRGQNHVGALGAGRHPRIDLDEQFAFIQRAADLLLVGESDFGIAADRDQRPDLAFPGRQDFVGQHVARHFLAEQAEAANPGFGKALAKGRHFRRNLGLLGPAHQRIEHHRRSHPLAFLVEACAEDVERGHQIFGERAIAGHFRTGSGHHTSLVGSGEHAGGGNELVLVDTGPFRCDIGRHRLDRCFQLFHAIDMGGDEILVV